MIYGDTLLRDTIHSHCDRSGVGYTGTYNRATSQERWKGHPEDRRISQWLHTHYARVAVRPKHSEYIGMRMVSSFASVLNAMRLPIRKSYEHYRRRSGMRPKPNCPNGPTGYHCSCWYAGLYCHFCEAGRDKPITENTRLEERGPHPIFTQEYLDAHIATRRKTAKS